MTADGDQPTYDEAHDAVLGPLLVARGVLDLVHAAEERGVLAALRDPRAAADLQDRSGLSPVALASLLAALEVNDVVQRVGDGYRLTPPWRVLTGQAARVPLATVLGSSDVERAVLRSLGGRDDYWTMSPEQRLTFARAISPDPFSPGLVDGFAAGLAADPSYDLLRQGGRLLELGCGVAGRALVLLQALPAMTAVGVELAPDLAAEAVGRSERLGLTERFEVVVADAADLDRPDSFDRGYWSQFFFAEASRGPALEAMRRCLRSGAVLEAPLLGDPEELAAAPHGQTARERAVFRVVLASWGVPDRDADELVAEIAGHGFVDVRADRGPFGNWRVVGRRA